MGTYYPHRTGFFLYCVLCFYTALSFALAEAGSIHPPLSMILWMIIGLFNGLYYIQLHLPLPAILTLPSRILFGRQYVHHKKKLSISDIFIAPPFIIIFLGLLIYGLWGVVSLLYPVPVYLFEQFWQNKGVSFSETISGYRLIYTLVTELSWLVMGGMIVFIAISLAPPLSYKNAFIGSITLSILLLLFLHYRVTGVADFSFYRSMTHWRGMGWDRFEDYNNLAEHTQAQASAFVRRYAELGLIGALFPYSVILTVIFFFCCKAIKTSRAHWGMMIAGILAACLIGLQDVVLVYHSYGIANACLFWAVIGFFLSYQWDDKK